MIRLRTVQRPGIIIQEFVIFGIFTFGVSSQEQKGNHFGFHFGIGPLELAFQLRVWNGTPK